MTSKECENQLNSLIEHFNNGGTDINAADIEAIKHLLLENQMQHKNIVDSKEKEKDLIKYLKDKIKKLKDECASYGHLIDRDSIHKFELQINIYQDILELLKSGKYE